MSRVLTLSSGALVGIFILGVSSRSAVSTPLVAGTVNLQDATPGEQQVGHVNISGVSRAAQFVGSGTGLINIPAPSIATGLLNDARLSVNIPRANGNTTFTGVNRFTKNVIFTSQVGTLLFPSVTAGNTRPMITMFATGSGNAPRMVIGHSTSFSNYGLEYVDETDRFHFTGAGFRVVTVDLISGRLGIGAEAPESKIQVLDNAPSNDHGSLFVQNGSNGTLFPQTRIGAYISAMGTGSGTIAVVGAASEFASGSSYGGFFEALGIGDNFGVYGSAISGTQNFAGYFNGQVYGTSASAGVKSFLIDHPSDPENKLLRHSSVESDQRMNIYRGKVRTDERGYASVTVPDWFDGLNVDIQYSLTVVDGTDSSDFVLAKVARKLDKGVFVIRTSIPNTEVHWMLSGVRNDATSQRYPLVVEEDKPASLRGKYLEPEAHGYGVERAMYPPPQRKAANDDPAQKR